jgi:uncharacterized membrane protein YgcG
MLSCLKNRERDKPSRGFAVVGIKQREKNPIQFIYYLHTMKKSIFMLAMAAMMFGSVSNTNAQDDNNQRQARRSDMRGRQTERLMKDLKLTDEQKAKFEPIYKNYQTELSALRTPRQQVDGQTGASAQDGSDKKEELTDAAATARLQTIFDRQAQQIQLSQQRLDIQKKYCAELSAFLTPQQLLRVFRPQQNPNQRQQGRGGQGRGGDFGGGRGPRGGFGGQGGFGGGPQGDL